MFRLWDKVAQDARLIMMLIITLGGMFLLLIILSVALVQSTKEHTLYLPPELTNGATIKTGEIDKSYVYSFVYTAWQMLNFWPKDAAVDAKHNLSVYRHYLSPNFRSQLQFKLQQTESQLQGRTKTLHGMHEGGFYEEANVKQLSRNSWLVLLKMQVVESYQGETIKQKNVLFPLRVNKVNVNRSANPFGLIISGFYENSKILD